jgi:amino acid adenylation domain-containing protein
MSQAAATDLSPRLSDVLPLSPLQSGLFFHAVSGDPDVYRYQLALDITGPLDVPLLRRCADLLLDRHTALRTGFVADEVDEPVAVVLDGLRMPWREIDLTGSVDSGGTQLDADLEAVAMRERTRPFTIDRPPLVRLTLVRLAEDRWQLLLTNHHLVLDGWSVPVLLHELFTLYAAHADPFVLPPARPYREHLAWIASRNQAQARDEWRRALAGLAGPTLLAPGSTEIRSPERHEIPVPAELSARLADLARERAVTLNTVLQVLWGLTLSTVTGTTDVVFGTTVNGRPVGSEATVGLFINTLPVRVRLDPGETVSELVDRIQREQAGLLDAQQVGLADIQRETGFAPLFDTLVVFESYPSGQIADSLVGTGLTVRPRSAQDATHYPLVLVAAPGDPMSLILKYQPQAVSATQVDQLAERLLTLAGRLADAPDRRIAALPAATDAELTALTSWNDTAAPITDSTLLDLFAAAVAANPDATAIRWDDGELSYRRLDELSCALAHQLRALGVHGEARVGLCLPRSPELVVASLAVLRAGGAFVPLDPEWPPLRVRGVAESAGVVAVCTAGALNTAPDIPVDVPVVAVDLNAPGAETPPPTQIDGEQVAYVIYTSGSTGTPKGAMIRHRSIGNRLVWQAGLLGFGPGDAALFKAPLGFDISINEIFLPLTTGATLVIAAPGVERDLEALAALIVSARVSFCYLTSSMLAALLELPDFASAAGLVLRHVWCGGELLTPELFARFRSIVDATMYHGYGPAETTIGVTHEIYRSGAGRDGATIGRPNPNTHAYVLDQFLRPVPPGVVGELYVGGLLLGRGYVGEPRRTAERFVADPFGTSGERLYRTGDLAAWLTDGRLRFAGRADNQVKIRGMRVEPEEVESVLAGHPDLGQSVVLALPDASGSARLVAFCAPRGCATLPGEDELRRWARERLPDHLMPAQWVLLPQLPTHDSGKVNRSALAALADVPQAEAVPPRTPTEERVLTQFRAVLGREDIGVTDDFFSSGGHSLLAVRLVLAVRSALDASLSVRTLLANPTAAELAAHLDDADAAPAPGLADAMLLPLRTKGSGAPLFCVHGASGLALNFSGLLGHLPNRPVYGLQARSLRTDTGLPEDLAAMAAEYVAEIRTVQPNGPYQLLGFSLGGTVAHLMAGQLRAAGERVESLVLLDSVPANWLPGPDPDWTLERGLARLLRAEGYAVPAADEDGIDRQQAAELVAARAGGLSAFGADDLCNVVLSWRHSATLGASTDTPTDTPVFDGDVLLFVAAREDRAGYPELAELWRPLVTGELQAFPIDADHMEMGRPGPLAEVAAHLR